MKKKKNTVNGVKAVDSGVAKNGTGGPHKYQLCIMANFIASLYVVHGYFTTVFFILDIAINLAIKWLCSRKAMK